MAVSSRSMRASFSVALFTCLLSQLNHALDYFYIYDTGYWLNISRASMYMRDDPHEILETTINNGAGPLVNAKMGAYHTDQYNLFLLIYHRALRDHRRTMNPAEASTFLIPYDMASDVAYYKRCAKSEGTCFDFRKCPLAPTVDKLLHESPWYHRHKGKDHLLLVGDNYAMEHYLLKPKCRAFLSGVCYNCTKMSIDDYSFLHSADQGTASKGDYWHAVPFPSDFHWTRKVLRPFPWENVDRPILVSYIGSARSYYGPARRLRGSLIHYCEMHPDICVHNSYGKNGTRSSFKVDGHDPLQISRRSVFCFQPIGDLMTRKGLFDSMLQGCIPVVFDPLTASVMYTWHWPEELWNEVAVDLPFHSVAYRYHDPVLALQALLTNHSSVVKRKQELLRERVFELQYSLEGPRDGEQQPSLHTHHGDNNTSTNSIDNNNNTTFHWPTYENGLLMRDAFDICIDSALGWHSGKLLDHRNATVPECWNGWLDKKANYGKGKCTPDPQPVLK